MSFHIFTSFLNIGDRIGPVVQKKPHSSRVRPRFKLKDCNHGTVIEDLNTSVHKAFDTAHCSVDLPDHCCVDLMDLMQNVVADPIQSSLVEQALPVVKIQLYRISYTVHVVYSVTIVMVYQAIVMVCHILFLLFMTI